MDKKRCSRNANAHPLALDIAPLLPGQLRFLEKRRISHLPFHYGPVLLPTRALPVTRTKTPASLSLSHNEESLLHTAVGFFSGQLHFLLVCGQSASQSVEKGGKGTDYHPLALSVCLPWVRFQCETFPELCLAGFWYLSWTEANSNWEQIAAFVGPWGWLQRAAQFRLICVVTALKNANRAKSYLKVTRLSSGFIRPLW